MPDITLSDDEVRALATLAGDSPIADKLRDALSSEWPDGANAWPEGTIAWIELADEISVLAVYRSGRWWEGTCDWLAPWSHETIYSITPIRVLRDDEIAMPRIAGPSEFRRAAGVQLSGSWTWRLLRAYADALDGAS